MSHQDKPCGNCKDCTCQEPTPEESRKHLDSLFYQLERQVQTVIGETGNETLETREATKHLWKALELIRKARDLATAAPQEEEKTA